MHISNTYALLCIIISVYLATMKIKKGYSLIGKGGMGMS